KHVGTGKTLTPTGSVSDGFSGNNYAITFSGNATGSISTRAITVTAATNNRMYDGTTSASSTPTIVSPGLAGSDTANFTESYQGRNVGSNLTLIPSGSVNDGNGGNNYAVTFSNSSNGAITTRAIAVTAAANSKGYDGTTSA